MDIKRFSFLRKTSPRVSVVRLDGVIGPSASRFRESRINIRAQASIIERAFKVSKLDAVALVVNSPGGSAVQSALVARRIRALADEKELPVLAFVEDVAASGGYWLAAAADEIFVNEASIVGSIGVISSSFGFQEFIKRYGIERRVHTAGENKAILDPFLPERAEDVERLKTAQASIHEVFKDYVKDRRGDRLVTDTPDLFSGAFWTGSQAIDLGLVDGIGDIRSVLRGRFGDEVQMVPVRGRKSALRSLFGRAQVPALAGLSLDGLPDDAISALEERLVWARYGL